MSDYTRPGFSGRVRAVPPRGNWPPDAGVSDMSDIVRPRVDTPQTRPAGAVVDPPMRSPGHPATWDMPTWNDFRRLVLATRPRNPEAKAPAPKPARQWGPTLKWVASIASGWIVAFIMAWHFITGT